MGEGVLNRDQGELAYIVRRNITWTWTFVIALHITDPSSRQRGRLTSTNQQLSENN
jgi:hypothetical protein